MLLMKESVLSLKEKSTQHWFSCFQIACKYQHSFMTNPLNNYLDDICIGLLGYNIEFSCLYLPQGLYCISTLWL